MSTLSTDRKVEAPQRVIKAAERWEARRRELPLGIEAQAEADDLEAAVRELHEVEAERQSGGSAVATADMGALLLDLLRRRCQVRFTQSLGERYGTKGGHTKCWVRLEGHGELTASEWRESPAAALIEAHGRAALLLEASR
jgi:hypothetical protein